MPLPIKKTTKNGHSRDGDICWPAWRHAEARIKSRAVTKLNTVRRVTEPIHKISSTSVGGDVMNDTSVKAAKIANSVPNGISETLVKLTANAARTASIYSFTGKILPLYRVTGIE